MTGLAISRLHPIEEFEAEIAENLRLAALDRFDVLDTAREEGFDAIGRLIRDVFEVPIGIVSVIDGHRQWYKACEGIPTTEEPRSGAFCNITVRQSGPVVVPDTLLDPRFAHHAHVPGEPNVRFYAGIPLRTRDGHNIGTLCAVDFKPRSFGRREVQILTDLGRLAMNEFEMRQLVTVDALTGVLSRRAFKEEGARVLTLARRHQLDLSLIAIDLDHFKMINDRHGHATGDRVLVTVAERCRDLMRRTDHIGRLGGEEFAVLLPSTDRRGALEAAEKLRAAVEGMTIEAHGERIAVTASFGVATLDPDLEDLDTFLARADVALYEAKGAGRNQAVAWRRPQGAGHSARRRVLKAGRIEFNGHASTLDCTVRFLSDEGAGVDLSSTMGVPERFDLRIGGEPAALRCRVVAKTERHLDVEFC